MKLPELGNRLRGLSEHKPGKCLRRVDLSVLSGNRADARIGTQGSLRNREIYGVESFAGKEVDLKVWQPPRLYVRSSLASAAHIQNARLHAAIALHGRRHSIVDCEHRGRRCLRTGVVSGRQEQKYTADQEMGPRVRRHLLSLTPQI